MLLQYNYTFIQKKARQIRVKGYKAAQDTDESLRESQVKTIPLRMIEKVDAGVLIGNRVAGGEWKAVDKIK